MSIVPFFDVQIPYERDGYYVARGLIPEDTVSLWAKEYEVQFKNRVVNPDKPQEVNGPFKRALATLYRHPAIIKLACEVFGPNIALYNYRFVVKDGHNQGGTFPHQDIGYHRGFARKASIFVALTRSNRLNGALYFYPGTHKLGYLGDAGHINTEKVQNISIEWPVLFPGDAVIMNSYTWHASESMVNYYGGPNDRILADIIVQPSDDPSGKELLHGEWLTDTRTPDELGELFVRSRLSRLRELQKENYELKRQIENGRSRPATD